MASDFLTTYTPLANDIATQTGLDPAVVLGIIDTETGGGQHVKGNNIFGISPGGKVASYKDVETGSQAFVDLLKSGRYAGVAGAGNPAAQAQALVKAGYNTANPNYAAIVAHKAATFGSQLGYQDNKPAASAAAPASAKDQLLTELGGDQKQPAAAPAAAPTAQPDAGKPKSAKDQLLEELSQPATGDTVAASKSDTGLGSEMPIEPPKMPAGPVPDPVGEAVVRVAKAGIDAAKQPGPDVFGPATGFWQQLNPGINALAAGGRALGAAGLQAIYEAGEPLGKAINIPTPWGTIGGPGLGGDLATMAMVAPAAAASPMYGRLGYNPLDVPDITKPAPPDFVSPAMQARAADIRAPAISPSQLRSFALQKLGYSAEDIAKMSPADADAAVRQGTYAPPKVQPAQLAASGTSMALPESTQAALRQLGFHQSDIDSLTPSDAAAFIKQGKSVGPPTQPSTPSPTGAVQPAGAQVTPASAASRTAREISHANTVADEEWLNTPQQPGVRDTRILVEGNNPTLAEQEQSVATSRELKRLRGENTEVSQDERELLNDASENRKTAFKQAVPSDLTLDTQAKAAGDKIENDLKTVWANKGTADVGPVKAQIATELDSFAGHLPPMKSAMKQVTDSLEAAGTDPRELYKTHSLINYLQSAQGKLENPGYGDAAIQGALTRTKRVLAGKINDAAPGFSDAMKTYSDAIGPIKAAKALNKEYNGLFNKDGYMDFGSVHRLMKDVIDAGHPDAPTNDLAGISDFQLQTLKDIHDDLKRSTAAQNLAKAYGSDTTQNLLDYFKGVGKTAGAMGVRGAMGYMFGPGGVIATDVGGRILGGIRENIAKRGQVARGREILRPPPPPQNPLNQPGP